MKTRTKILIGTIIAAVLTAGLITGGLLMKHNAKPTEQDYIAFLKEHEKEMVDYVKEKNPKVTSVQWDWDSAEVSVRGNGLPWGGGEVLSINGKFNQIENSNFRFKFDLVENQGKDIDYEYMWVTTLYIGGEIFYE